MTRGLVDEYFSFHTIPVTKIQPSTAVHRNIVRPAVFDSKNLRMNESLAHLLSSPLFSNLCTSTKLHSRVLYLVTIPQGPLII